MNAEDKPDKSLSKNGIQVISRAAEVLRTLRNDPHGLSLGKIAERTGLARSTVQRIVAALQEERLVITVGDGGIRLGPELTALATAARFNVVETCRLHLSELVQRTGETADLSVFRGEGMIFLDQVPGTHRLRTVSSVGDVFPMTNTANGRAALAQMDPDQARDLAQKEWDRRGVAGDWNELETRLKDIRKTGLAFDCDEHTDGISAIGIAFTDWSGDLHSISVPIPSTRFEKSQEDVCAALKDLSARMQQFFA